MWMFESCRPSHAVGLELLGLGVGILGESCKKNPRVRVLSAPARQCGLCGIIDGLIVSNFGPEIFRAMRAGGITAANCTCSIWEDFPTSMRAIAQWKTWFRERFRIR
jgi:hypothetical protein